MLFSVSKESGLERVHGAKNSVFVGLVEAAPDETVVYFDDSGDNEDPRLHRLGRRWGLLTGNVLHWLKRPIF